MLYSLLLYTCSSDLGHVNLSTLLISKFSLLLREQLLLSLSLEQMDDWADLMELSVFIIFLIPLSSDF